MKTLTTILIVCVSLWAGLASAQDLSGKVGSVFLDKGGDIRVLLPEAVAYRVRTLDAPRRLVLEFKGISKIEVPMAKSATVSSLRSGQIRAGWMRVVADLTRPLAVESVELNNNINDVGYTVKVTLKSVSNAEFTRLSSQPPAEPVSEQLIATAMRSLNERSENRPILVALDPGHGGIDPGAHRGGVTEKQITIEFSRELKKQLLATGQYEVVLTRQGDDFVSLKERVARARDAHASLMISVHVNTVTKGRASGAAVYVLGEAGDDREAEATAIFENNSDTLVGLAPEGTETDVLRVLSSMAQVETDARSALLAENLLDGLRASVGVIRSHPSRAAEFLVLQAPDVPSVLLELGFLSDKGDRADLMSPEWRTQAAGGIVAALDAWVVADTAAARLARQ